MTLTCLVQRVVIVLNNEFRGMVSFSVCGGFIFARLTQVYSLKESSDGSELLNQHGFPLRRIAGDLLYIAARYLSFQSSGTLISSYSVSGAKVF